MSENHFLSVNLGKTATQPQRIVATLILTSILSLGANAILLQVANAAPRQLSQSTASEMVKGKPGDNRLPPQLANAVRQDLSRKAGIARGKLKIIEYNRKTWSNGCLEIARRDEFCTEALVPGWRIVLSDGNQTWVYHTDTQGRNLRLETQTSSTNLPKSISDALLQDAASRLGVQIAQLSIVKAEQKTWSNPCIFNFGEICTREYNPVSGWEVTVNSRQQSLVYRTDQSGSQIASNKQANQSNNVSLPEPIAKAVLQQASEQSSLPISAIRIVKAEPKSWPDRCLGVSSPLLLCGPEYRDGIPGWLVSVQAGQQRLVYRTNDSGTSVKFDAVASVPGSLAKAVLRNAAQVSRLPIYTLRIIQAEKQTWDGCLGISKPGVACTKIGIPGWKITVTDGKQLWVYHTDNGSKIVLNESASHLGDADIPKATKIPQSELPPPLKEGAVFRAIASGGITGRTYQTTLMNDGQVIRVAVTPNNAEAQPIVVRQLSPQEIQQFQQLLERQKFSSFNQLSYPAANGAADYITITLANSDTTTKYADIVQSNLPSALQEVIQAWNRISQS